VIGRVDTQPVPGLPPNDDVQHNEQSRLVDTSCRYVSVHLSVKFATSLQVPVQETGYDLLSRSQGLPCVCLI
jgi:hypothetical protein